MQFNDFKRIVTCFADRVDDVDTSHGELLVQIRDETITARLHQRSSGLLVEEHDARMPAVGMDRQAAGEAPAAGGPDLLIRFAAGAFRFVVRTLPRSTRCGSFR